MPFVRERQRSRRTTKHDPQRAERAIKPRIARRRAEEERADMPFVRERRRSRRTTKRDPQRAERAIEHSQRVGIGPEPRPPFSAAKAIAAAFCSASFLLRPAPGP
jgi:hypothetical protein